MVLYTTHHEYMALVEKTSFLMEDTVYTSLSVLKI